MKYYIDTNILIYLNTPTSFYHKYTKLIIDDFLLNNPESLYLNEIVTTEFYALVTHKTKTEISWSMIQAREYIFDFLKVIDNKLQLLNREIYYEALNTLDRYNIKSYNFYDHLIAFSMKYYGIEGIITVNSKDFEKYEFIKDIITPSKEKKDKNRIIPYGRQWIDNKDIQIVVNTLKSDYLTQGPKVKEFEEKLCEYTGAKYAVAVANGTAALHLAVKSLELENNFEGITTPNTFVASSNCIAYNQGSPIFTDIEPDTHNIDTEKIKEKLTEKTKVLIPVDFAGHPCDMESIYNIAKENNLFIIRDACHSIGSIYKNEKTGNCKYSDITIFSFHPVKHITTGEGGAVLTNNEELYHKLLLLRTHGITKEPDLMQKNDGIWYYEMIDLGYNYRITDIQCALGISQLDKLDKFIERRREIVSQYNETFKDIEHIKIPVEKEHIKSSYHLYVVEIEFDKIGLSRQEFMLKLREKGILTQVHYIPVHLQPYYRNTFGYKENDYPIAETYYQKALSLPLYPAMSDSDVKKVINEIKELMV